MSKTLFNENHFFVSACYFEAALLLVALLIGYLTDINPFTHLYFSEKALAIGVIATIPLGFLFIGLHHWQIKSMQTIRQFLIETLCPYLYKRHWSDLLLLSTITGFSEEVLFRGAIQPWLESFWSVNVALLVSNLLFGLVHSITPLYALLATLVGIYLGISLDISGERDLLIPIIIHSLYDFFAFMVLMRTYKASQAQG
ncbi:MAG: CPBP family intramembrane glutamic endopeptidase [Methylococcaceae bacterium]